MADQFAYSPDDVVRALYQGLLDRSPDDAAVSSWASAIERGVPLGDVVRGFATSPERIRLEQRSGPGRPVVPPFASSSELVAMAGRLTVIDVGARRPADEADAHRALVESGRATVVGFEPLEGGAGVRRRDGWTVLPRAVGDGSRRTFHETVWGPSSSLYEPDLDVMGDLDGLTGTCEVRARREIDTVCLDDALAGVVDGPVDLLEIDVQGAELDVLRGAKRTLGDTLVVHAEAALHPLYRDQPLLADVLAFLRDAGFDLFDLPRLERYRYAGTDGRHPARRLVRVDTSFIPDRATLDGLDEARTLRLAWVMHDLYAAVDFVAWLLARFDGRTGTGYAGAYRALVA
jgi:FkbM family methyltransferase